MTKGTDTTDQCRQVLGFKYQILVDHLKYEEALLIAYSYTNSPQPYTETMASLTEHYGQPHQLALRKIAELMDAANITRGDMCGLKLFALKVRALVGMLDQLGDNGQTELHCRSHVTQLLCKLPQDMRAEFRGSCIPCGSLFLASCIFPTGSTTS